MNAPPNHPASETNAATSVGPAYFWAKTVKERDAQGREIDLPGISVRDHCLNVGCVMEALIARLPKPLQALLPSGAATLAALHDIGKISPGFQQKCDAWQKRNPSFKPDDGYQKDHAHVSQADIQTRCPDLQLWAEAVGAHHGRIQGFSLADLGDKFWVKSRGSLVAELSRIFGNLPTSDANEVQEWFFAGLLAAADWIGSDKDFFAPDFCEQPLVHDVQSGEAAKAIARLRLFANPVAAGLTFSRAFPRIAKPRPLQKIVNALSAEPGVYVIEDQMGSGKTEAALWLAYRLMAVQRARGLYFALPTRTTSDRIHRRVEEFLKALYPDEQVLPLVHGHAWLRSSASAEVRGKFIAPNLESTAGDANREMREARAWFASTRTGLLAPFAVGTLDQALLGTIAAKHFFVRQFALAGKVVVLDEVHSYDLYTGTLIALLMRRLRELHATVVVLSATLTARQRAHLLGQPEAKMPEDIPYPLLSGRTDNGPVFKPIKPHARSRSVQIDFLPVKGFEDRQTPAQLAANLARRGQCVLWIRNTVEHAQAAYEAAKAACQGDNIQAGLLHSRFPAFQRGSYPIQPIDQLQKLGLHEEFWLRVLGPDSPDRPRGCVLVATQVVEQSVDIDADALISDLAPTDMIFQRLGRLHRHRQEYRRPAARLFVVCPEVLLARARTATEKELRQTLTPEIYSRYVMLRSFEVWRETRETQGRVTLPRDIRPMLEATYRDSAGPDPEPWQKFAGELREERDRLANLALAASNVRGQELAHDEEGVHTRYCERPQVLLVLFRNLPTDPRLKRIGVCLLDGKEFKDVDARRYDLEVARALHRNAVPVPAWWLKDAKGLDLPQALAGYFHDAVAWARLPGSHDDMRSGEWEHLLLGGVKRAAPVLIYNKEIGVRCVAKPDSKEPSYDDEDVQSGE